MHIHITLICSRHFTRSAVYIHRTPHTAHHTAHHTTHDHTGATHNNLGDYASAVDYHSSAASLHGRLGNRRAQCGCFLNLGYASARLGKYDSAADCYLHAHRAALDVQCYHDAWRALEGGGGAAFRLRRYARAAEFFADAVGVLNELVPGEKGRQ